MSKISSGIYIKGLNTFRFFAAFLVIISHGQQSLVKVNGLNNISLPILDRGREGVEFFFVLSGFLITYLLSTEIDKSGTVSIKGFYMRRIFRIWPLYFIILALGTFILCFVYPFLYHKPFFQIATWKWLTLFIFFLPNLATRLYPMGLLNPLWSIGVEEQFYLFWAPFVKLFKKRILVAVVIFIIASSVWQLILEKNVLNFSSLWLGFFKFQKFYSMAIGGLFGYFFKCIKVGQKIAFIHKLIHVIVFTLILIHLFFIVPYSDTFIYRFFLSALFGLLIFYTAILSDLKPILNFEFQPLIYLGTISYGLYCYHMTIDYLLRIILLKSHLFVYNKYLLLFFYESLLILTTVVISAISFRYVESYFLRLKAKFNH